MEINMDPLQRQMLDDVFDAFTMLTNGSMVSLMHVKGGFTRYTASAVELFGLPGEYVPNGAMDWNDYLHPEDRKRYMDTMVPLLEGKTQTYDITYRVRTVSGGYRVIRAVGAVLRSSDGRPSLIGGAMFNEGLTERIDPVTVLPNKNAFQEDFGKKIKEGAGIFALQVGIDRFIEINRVHGYTYGNHILQEMTWLIQEAVGNRGSVYRLNEAAFAVLTDSLTREGVAALYDHIRYQLQRGVEINGTNNILMAAGGMVSIFSADADVTAVCSCLNYAYNESKTHTHGELVDFNGSINYGRTESIAMINKIRDCIEDDCQGFGLEYLPVVSVKTGEVNGAEATVYWENEKYGRVEPEDFIPILEQDFIFEELGDFILQCGLTEGARFLEKNPGFLLCLNVYRIQLESGYFVENLLAYLKETGFPPELLSLKFDSDCRLIGMEKMKDIIAGLHAHKILVIIGDFGSGVDSIGFLKSEPVDAVSIAGQFTEGLESDVKARNTLQHLIEIAHDYVRHINVKGIDNGAMKEIVGGFSISTMQGEYFSKPLSFAKMMDYLS